MGAALTVSHSRSVGDKIAVAVLGRKSQLTACGVEVRDAKQSGFKVLKGAGARLTECSASRCEDVGMFSDGEASELHTEGGSVAQNPETGVSVEAGGKRYMQRVALSHCKRGVVGYHDSTVDVQGCSFKKNSLEAVHASAASAMEVRESHTYNNGIGYVVGDNSKLSLSGCSSDSDGGGCVLSNRGELVYTTQPPATALGMEF